MHSDENLPAAWSATKNAGTPPELDEIVPGSWWRITGAFKDFAEREAPDHGLIFLLGDVRIIDITGTDLQPCGGTHVRATGEIGRLRVGKIENKGAHNRRINIHLAD